MKSIIYVLDIAREACLATSDSALADRLGVTRQAVSNWRHGRALPDPVACDKLATLAGMPLAQVLGLVGEARAISRDEKAVWHRLALSAALSLLCVAMLQPMHIMLQVRACIRRLYRPLDGECAPV